MGGEVFGNDPKNIRLGEIVCIDGHGGVYQHHAEKGGDSQSFSECSHGDRKGTERGSCYTAGLVLSMAILLCHFWFFWVPAVPLHFPPFKIEWDTIRWRHSARMRCIYIMNLVDLLSQPCPWLLDTGEENDIVIGCRIRLMRNLVGFPFPIRATEQDRYAVQRTVQQAAKELFTADNYYFTDIQLLPPLDREYLMERQLISQELVLTEQAHALLIDRQEQFCVIVNEEDHIQIHAAGSGLAPQSVWEQVNQIDDLLASKLDYVFHEKYGFLTSSIATVGTGMKIYAMLHLPALVIVSEMDKVARSLQKKNLIIRGLYGEGNRAYGDFFLVSNRITLGKSEEELVAKMTDLIPQIVAFERQARSFLVTNRRDIILDRCSRSVGVLRTAQTINCVEAMLHLSNIRLGIHTGLLQGLDISTINLLLLHSLPAHIQMVYRQKEPDAELSQAEQDVVRATYIRQRINESAPSSL